MTKPRGSLSPHRLGSSAWSGVALCLLATSVFPRAALANGAFPAPFKLFLPLTRPDDVTVTTNFGLILTRDRGKTWSWSCEHGASDLGTSYQQAVTSDSRRMLGLAKGHLVYTDDDGCAWSTAVGVPSDVTITDSFIDPSNPQHVLAIGQRGTGPSSVFQLFESTSGGSRFDAPPLYMVPPGTRLDGVEVAKSNPKRVYLTTSPWSADGTAPYILRSDDGGKTFTTLDPSPEAASGTLKIVAVDPQNADRVHLRHMATDDRLLVTNDGGKTLAVALTVSPGQELTAFLRRETGTLFVAAFDSFSGSLYRSVNGGGSFETLSTTLRIGAIAERDGALYVLADGLVDPILVGVSRDDGGTFQSFLEYQAVKGVQACGTDLRPVCAASCKNLNDADVFSPSVCTALAGAVAATPMATAPAKGSCAVGAAGRGGDVAGGLGLGMLFALWGLSRTGRSSHRR